MPERKEVPMNHEKIEQAVQLFLEGIGENPEREGLQDTPRRIADMCGEIFGGYGQEAGGHLSRTFSSEAGGMVVERDIPFYSVCEHHLLPFFGKVHIGYIPDGRVVGLSKLSRTVEVYARRAQIQERLTDQIADAIMTELKPKGVMVMIEAEHLCMSMRGIQKPGTKTATCSAKGMLEKDSSRQQLFMKLIGR